MNVNAIRVRTKIRFWLAVFMAGLVLSGLTAFPLEAELRILSSLLGIDPDVAPSRYAGLQGWIALVAAGIRETNAKYPFLAYGTDWLAFAYRDPVRNSWVVTFGIIACIGVIPLALIAGAVRGIPFYWRLIDCSFGVFGVIPLWLARRNIEILESDKT